MNKNKSKLIALLIAIELIAVYMFVYLPTRTSALPPTFSGTVSQRSFCQNGPDEDYLGAIILSPGLRVEVLATNSDSRDWFMIRGQDINPCWVKASALELPSDFNPKKVFLK